MVKNKLGFTMIEILIVIVILAVLTGIAVPAYRTTVEQSRANEAITNLNILHMGEKIYRLNNSTFIIAANLAAANTALNTDMGATYYPTLTIVAGGTGSIATSYTARFTRGAAGGGNGTDWYQYDFTNGNAAPVCTKTGAVPC